MNLFNNDCVEILPTIGDNSIDCVIVDMPYGTTKCKWDQLLDMSIIWQHLWRITNQGAPIVMFCTQPFTSVLIYGQIKYFKYAWTWDKMRGRGHLVSKIRPMQQTEDIAVFGRGKIRYYPQQGEPYKTPRHLKEHRRTEIMGGKITDTVGTIVTHRRPTTLLQFSPIEKPFHPTQKPIELLEYLVHTYTQPGDVILDFTMGSGTTGIAAKKLNRDFIGIEKDERYFDYAVQRINNNATKD